VLLFPFYWMALTAIKPDEQLLDLELQSVLDLDADVQASTAVVRHPVSAMAHEHDAGGDRRDRAHRSSPACHAAYAIVRLRCKGAQWVGGAIFLACSHSALDPVHPALDRRLPVRAVRHPFALI
jgi:multiple sugar transport system permease protein